jgi:hypothetical protein
MTNKEYNANWPASPQRCLHVRGQICEQPRAIFTALIQVGSVYSGLFGQMRACITQIGGLLGLVIWRRLLLLVCGGYADNSRGDSGWGSGQRGLACMICGTLVPANCHAQRSRGTWEAFSMSLTIYFHLYRHCLILACCTR